ncbi:PIG-L family deacetylase [Deinococcus sp. KNUC1210]|uniref:PIG-L deacetylase family protein n=1 Tax=Deinococcus sp. KNUC1210 TaxID=2917691 RepID=UPI001EEFBFE8|nr:PIG-L family deacetylase [Deinococcus sp. KNUC1210]ULH16268.1 PIG-L family deacetylase [Deinococcus sp. KNUC1210]
MRLLPTRQRWLPPFILVSLALALWINFTPFTRLTQPRAAMRVERLPATSAFYSGQKIMILSPHPDDETLCCAGMIQQAHAAGADVYVTWLTSGDGFEFDAALEGRQLRPGTAAFRKLALRRMQEARAAAAVLDIPASHLNFLGYPDGGLFRLFLENYATAYTSPTSGLNRVNYDGTFNPGSAYTGLNLERDMASVVDAVNPDLLLVPAPQDAHLDHRTVSYLAQRLMAERGQTARLRFWVVHGGLEWPLPKGLHRGDPLTLPSRAMNLAWTRDDLTPAQVLKKGEAIAAYRTQITVLGRFMVAFERKNELLSTTALPPGPLGEGVQPIIQEGGGR